MWYCMAGLYHYGVSVADVPSGIPGASAPAEAALGIIKYAGWDTNSTPMTPDFPPQNDPEPFVNYIANLRGYDPYDLPVNTTHKLVYTIAIERVPCTIDETTCTQKLAGAVQNITWDDPQGTSILEAYYNNVDGVYTTDFPNLPVPFEDFVGQPNSNYMLGKRGTRVKELRFNDTVELVLQNVWALGIIDHPFHLHGHDFYVVGRNYGNFDPNVDPLSFNLVDPPMYNTFSIPLMGWIALRFRADNPGEYHITQP